MLELKNVVKEFTQGNVEQKVLKGIDLKIADNDFVTIMGPSGGGKSTLLYTLGLLSEPTSGKVLINNKKISFKNEKAIEDLRRENIGLVFQNSNLISCISAVDNIIIAMDSDESYRKKKEKAEDLLKKVGLYDKRNTKALRLSGGEAQRVAIVRSLVNNPKIILCDEPTGALDSDNGRNVMNLLMDIKKERECALVVVTHDENIGSLGERQIILEDGELREVV